jgi:hypothetical protein
MDENDVAAQAAAQAASSRQYDWRPRPDPTILTTQQLRETEAAINRGWHEAIAALRELLEQRLNGMDKATELVADRLDKFGPELRSGREQLRSETGTATTSLRELLESRLSGMDKAIELLAANLDKSPSDIQQAITQLHELLGARIDGMDIATKLLAENVDKVPSDIDRSVRALRELLQGEIRNVQDVAQEKFSAIDGTFASNALALTAALAAQKEAAAEQNKSNTLAITKSEQATKETISANAAQTTAGLNSQAATINDLKERLVRMEAGGVGRTEQRGEQRSDETYDQMERMLAENRIRAAVTTGISALAVIVSVVVAIVLIIHH